MYYGEGRLRGNIGVYLVPEANKDYDAYRLAQNATAFHESVQLPKKFKHLPSRCEQYVDAIMDQAGRKGIYSLDGGRAYFLEFYSESQLLEKG